ncbi:hypothetical protein [Salipiger sp. PrR003]|uniref:hypothetical protein n=1 Tax=Salipiger sp. PrR003 TaxID=2706776 RepID=UPI0013D90984|nr:hypothetical protein [Salipiger sp. PrR003]NDV50596.1 hypothetical protein [Salipiger sp. PrR003]
MPHRQDPAPGAPSNLFHHRGAAEALGVTTDELENMSMRELSDRCYDLGLEPVFRIGGGVDVGLTMRADPEGDVHKK